MGSAFPLPIVEAVEKAIAEWVRGEGRWMLSFR